MSENTLGQVAFEALKSASADTLGPGLTWEAAPDWVREKWEKIGQAVAENVRQQCMEDVYTAMPDGVPYELSDVIAAWRHGERP